MGDVNPNVIVNVDVNANVKIGEKRFDLGVLNELKVGIPSLGFVQMCRSRASLGNSFKLPYNRHTHFCGYISSISYVWTANKAMSSPLFSAKSIIARKASFARANLDIYEVLEGGWMVPMPSIRYHSVIIGYVIMSISPFARANFLAPW